MLSKIPNERLERSLIESLTHPVERRAQVVDKFLTRKLAAHFSSQLARLGDVRVAGFHPQEVGIGCELTCALGCGGEAGAVVVESFAGAGAVAGPDDGGFYVVVCQGSTAGEGEVGVLGDLGLVCFTG